MLTLLLVGVFGSLVSFVRLYRRGYMCWGTRSAYKKIFRKDEPRKFWAFFCANAVIIAALLAFTVFVFLRYRTNQTDRAIHENSRSKKRAEPGATAQRPQLSRPVHAHVSRQPGSWLTWDVDIAAWSQVETIEIGSVRGWGG